MDLLLTFLRNLAVSLGDDTRYDDLIAKLEAVEPAELSDEQAAALNLTAEQAATYAVYGNADADLIAELNEVLLPLGSEDEQFDALPVQTITDAADLYQAIGESAAVNATLDAALQEQRDDARARLAPAVEEEAPAEVTDEATTEQTTEAAADETPDEGGGTAPAEGEPVPVTASGDEPIPVPNVAQVAMARRGQNTRQPQPTVSNPSPQWALARQVGTRPMGQPVDDRALDDALFEGLDAMRGVTVGGEGKDVLARLNTADRYGPGRNLSNAATSQEVYRDWKDEKDAIVRSAKSPAEALALVASGGICAPPTPIYEIATVGDDARPVRDFLPSFLATRGGVTLRPGVNLQDIGAVNTDNSGVTVWTNTIDTTPGQTVKNVLSVTCNEPVVTRVEAIVARLQFGNFMEAYDRETIAALRHEQMKFWARIAETQLLTAMETASDASMTVPTPSGDLGFAREVLSSVGRVAVALRGQNRMDPNEVLDVYLPSWVPQAMVQDRTLEIPGAPSDTFDGFSLGQIDAWFMARGLRTWFLNRGLRVCWFRDTQQLELAVDGQAVPRYPGTMKFYISEMGHFLFLDGGRLDLGIFRDSVLNDTNDAQTFMESMEGLANPGVTAWDVTLPVCISGSYSGPVDIDCDEGS